MNTDEHLNNLLVQALNSLHQYRRDIHLKYSLNHEYTKAQVDSILSLIGNLYPHIKE